MFKEVLLVKPKLDPADLNKMDRTLNTRFSKVAKTFSGGLRRSMNSIFKGGLIASAATLVAKLLNPIQDVESSINKTLQDADNIVTRSKQFESSPGKFFKLQQVAASAGLEGQTLDMMLSKFQVALAEARAMVPEGKKNEVSAFVGEKDTAEAFFKFAQSMQKLTKDQQVLVQQQIFGERLLGKAAEFFQTDYEQRLKELGAKDSKYYDKALNKIASLEDMQAVLGAKRTLGDMPKKAGLLNTQTIKSMDLGERLKLEQENARLKSYEDIKATSNAMDQIKAILETNFMQLASVLQSLVSVGNKIAGSRLMRGLGSFLGGD